jgi:hypothetical protein
MLQLDATAALPVGRVAGAHRTGEWPVPPRPEPPPTPAAQPPNVVAPTTPSPSPSTDDTRTLIARRGTAAPASAPASVPAAVIDAPPLDLSGDDEPPRLLEPLFAAHQARAIVAAAVATRRHDGDVDVARALEDVTRRRPLRRLPRVPRASLQAGCQILVDYSRAMEPYAADREALVHALRTTVGEPRVSVYAFRGPPLGTSRGGRPDPDAWRPPPRGTPIVIVSDLGIGGPPLDRHRTTRQDWLALATRARRARCPLVAFVPFGPKRWDPVLARHITHVHWDRPTSVGVVRRAIGPGHPIA